MSQPAENDATIADGIPAMPTATKSKRPHKLLAGAAGQKPCSGSIRTGQRRVHPLQASSPPTRERHFMNAANGRYQVAAKIAGEGFTHALNGILAESGKV